MSLPYLKDVLVSLHEDVIVSIKGMSSSKLSQQVPIYFVSKALTGSKKYYLKMEKICYTIVMSVRKL
jgi:hypothetical protein